MLRTIHIASAMTLTVLLAAALFAFPTFASPVLQSSATPLLISNNGSENALSIMQNGDVGKSRSESGALLIDNTKNDNTGLTVYSNAGDSAKQPLIRMEIDNPAWTEEVLYIHSDSPTSRGLIRLDSPAPEIEFVETDQSGASGKFEVRVQHDEFQINSRRADDTTFENKISMTHTGDLILHSGSLIASGSAPSEFAGGINVTGGCIAIDGKCVIESANDMKTAEAATQSASSAENPSPAVAISSGAPDTIACNSYDERGALTLDVEHNRMYVCNGPERGWDYFELTN